MGGKVDEKEDRGDVVEGRGGGGGGGGAGAGGVRKPKRHVSHFYFGAFNRGKEGKGWSYSGEGGATFGAFELAQ